MKLFTANFKWIMLLSGILTCTMIIGLFFPEKTLVSNFGETINGEVANIIVRNWAALIALVGMMLVYGAFVPVVRHFSLVMAGISKLIFIALILVYGKSYLGFGIGTAVWVDLVMIVLFVAYLLASFKTVRPKSN